MSFVVQTRWGGSEDSPSPQRLREILGELDVADDEHPDTWLTHESGWTLSAFHQGLVVFENPEEAATPPRHMLAVSRERVLGLWLQLAAGNPAALEQEPWQPGYG